MAKLNCPIPDCQEQFNDHHDERAETTMLSHLQKDHEWLHDNLELQFLGVGQNER